MSLADRRVLGLLSSAFGTLLCLPLVADELPAGGRLNFLEDVRENVYIVASEGPWRLARVDGTTVKPLLKDAASSVAIARDGRVFFTLDEAIYSAPLDNLDKRTDETSSFGGRPRGDKHVVCTALGEVWVEGCPKRRLADGSFALNPKTPTDVASPVPLVIDAHGNHWALRPAADGTRSVLMLPKQAPGAWRPVTDGKLGPGAWRLIETDEFGGVWLAGRDRVQRFDPANPDAGLLVFQGGDGIPSSEPVVMVPADGMGVEVARQSGQRTVYRQVPPAWKGAPPQGEVSAGSPPKITSLRTMFRDSRGRTWLAHGTAIECQPAPANAWQKHWKLTARMPHSNHDLHGAVLGDRLYVAGGMTKMYGFPSQPKLVDEVWEYRPDREVWTVPAKLAGPRVYNAVAAFDGKLWVIGGDTLDENERRVPTDRVETYDPKQVAIAAGPKLLAARAMPVAAVLGERLYVVGDVRGRRGASPCESIGRGEREWQAEPDAPFSLGSPAACVFAGKWYVWTQGGGIKCFDPATSKWEPFETPHRGRVPEMTAHAGRLWVLGGRGAENDRGVFAYDPKMKAWQPGPDLPRPLSWAAAVELGGALHVAGGAAELAHAKGEFVFSNATFRLRDSAETSARDKKD